MDSQAIENLNMYMEQAYITRKEKKIYTPRPDKRKEDASSFTQYTRAYYEKNHEKIREVDRNKYHSDEQYRRKEIDRRKALYHKKKQEFKDKFDNDEAFRLETQAKRRFYYQKYKAKKLAAMENNDGQQTTEEN